MKTSNKLKVYKLFFKVLLIALLLVLAMIVIKYAGYQIVEKENVEVVEVFNNTEHKIDENGVSQIEMRGYKVIGKIKISKINLEYPI